MGLTYKLLNSLITRTKDGRRRRKSKRRYVYGTSLFYNFSGIAIASETSVIIGQELKVRGWPAIAVEFTSPNEYDSVVSAHAKQPKSPIQLNVKPNEALNVFPSRAQPSPTQLRQRVHFF